MGKLKPKFNPNESFEVVENTATVEVVGEKPKFDPSLPFTAVEKKSANEGEVISKDLSQPSNVQKPLSGGLGTNNLLVDGEDTLTPVQDTKPISNPKTQQEKIDYLKQDLIKQSLKTPMIPGDETIIDLGLNINNKPIVEAERISSEIADEEKEAELKKIDNGVGVVKNFVAHIDQAFYGLPATVLETVAIGANQLSRLNEVVGGERVSTEEQPTYKLAKWYRESLAEIAPTNPAMQDDLNSKVATSLGDLASLVMSGGARMAPKVVNELAQFTKASNVLVTGAKEAGKLLATPPALVGAMQMGVGEFNTAKSSGATDDEAFDAFIKNAGVGSVLEAIPIMKFFKRLDTTTGGGVKKLIANGSVQGVEEMTTEVAQQMYSNVNAANTYDTTRKWYDGMVESGGIGFGLGFFLGGMGTSLRKKHSEAKTDEEKAQIQKAIDFVEEKGAELKTQQENIDKKVNGNTNTEEVNTAGETTENIPEQQVPVSEEVAPGEELETSGIETTEETATIKEPVIPEQEVVSDASQGEDVALPQDKELITLGIAPYRNKTVESFNEVSEEDFGQINLKENIETISGLLGIPIKVNNNSAGGWFDTDNQKTIKETSRRVQLEVSDPKQAEFMGALLAVLGPEVQQGVYNARYSNDGPDMEVYFEFDSTENAEKAVEKLNEFDLGNGFSFDNTTKTLYIGDIGGAKRENILKFIDYAKDKGLKNSRGKRANITFPGEGDYRRILQEGRDRGYYGAKHRDSLDNLVLKAQEKLGIKNAEAPITEPLSNVENPTLSTENQIPQKVIPPDSGVNQEKIIDSGIPPAIPGESTQETEGDNQDVSGIKKSLVSDEIIAGVDLNKIKDKDMQALAAKIIATGEVNPESIVNEILTKPRALQPKEVVAMIYYKAKLDNKLRDAYKKKNELFEAGEPTGSIDAEILDTERLVENFDIVAVITASQQSLAFRLRKGMLDKEYNLVVQINKYKSVNKGVIPPDVEAKFRELDKKLKEVNDQLSEAEKRAEVAEEELAIKNVKESIARERIKTNIKIASKDLASKIRKAKFHKPGIFSSATPITVLVDTALEASASVIEAGGTIAQAIAEGWALIKKSDWYKGLNSDKQKEAEDAFSNMVSPKDPSEERLKIPNSLVREAVEAGNETIEDVTKFIHKVIKDDYPNVTEREIRDAITGYGKTVNMSKDEIDTQIRKIKRMGKIISSMEDIQNKKRPLKTGLQRDKLDAEERVLGKQLKEAMKDLPLDVETESRQLKTSLDAVKARLKNQIEDLNREIETGEKSAKAKAVPYDEEAKLLIEERDRVKSLHDDIFGKSDLTDEQKLDRAVKSTERSIAETDRRIAEKDLEIKKSKPVDSAVLKEARERLSRSKEVLRKLQEDAGIPERKRLEQTKKNAERRIKQLQEKLKNNDFSKRTPKPVIADTELIKLQAEKLKIQEEFEKAQYKNELKNRPLLKKWADVGLELFSSLWRALAASFDLSAVLVQGLIPTVRHPKDALHSLKEMFKQLASEKYQAQVMANIKAQEWYPAMKASKLAITEIDGKYNAREEMFVSNWVDVIWDSPANLVEKAINQNKFSDGWKAINPYKAANRAYTGYLNSMRVLRYLDGAKYIESQGKTFESHPEEYKAWADYINNTTGRGGLGPLENSAKALSLAFFSPRKIMSGLNLFTPYTFIYFGKMPKAVRQKAIMDYASSLTILTTTAILWQAAIKADDEEEDWGVFWDSNSTDFMKPKIGNTRIDLFGGRQQQLVVMSRLLTGEFVDSHGKATKLGHRFGKDINTRKDVVTKFFSNKFTPSLAFAAKVLDQKKGIKTDWEDESIKQVMPIWIRDVDELYKEHPTEIAIMLNLLTVFGGGVQTYGTKKKKKEDK